MTGAGPGTLPTWSPPAGGGASRAPRRRLQRWQAVALGVLAVLALAVLVELRSASAVAPPPDAQFGNGQSVTVAFTGGLSRVVYVQTKSGLVRNASPATDQLSCQAVALQQGTEVAREPLSGLRLNSWWAVEQLSANRDGPVRITCQGPDDARFGVGAAIPPRRLLDGVRRVPPHPEVFLAGATALLLIVGVLTHGSKSPARPQLRWVLAPLAVTVVMAVAFNSVVFGALCGALGLAGLGLLGLALRGMGLNRAPSRASWRGWAAALAVMALLAGAGIWQNRSAAALVPATDAEFTTGRPFTVSLSAGETRGLYAHRANTPQTAFTCAVSGPDLTHIPIHEDIRVKDWMAVGTLQANRAVRAEVSCSGPSGSRFGVGAPLPPRRIFDGANRFPGVGPTTTVIFGGFALAGLLALAARVLPLSGSRKRAVYLFWSPLVFITAVTLILNDVELGMASAVVWFLIAGWSGAGDDYTAPPAAMTTDTRTGNVVDGGRDG